MKPRTGWMRVLLVLAIGTFSLSLAATMSAQVQTTQSTAENQSTTEVQVENSEVLAVEGNDLVLRMDDGSIRHIADVPDSARATVDGKEIGIHDVKPGMKLQRTIITTTTPQVITTVQTVTGKVFHVSPPNSVILTLENGENQTFKIPSGQKFNVDGQEMDAWGLRKGMLVSATKVVEQPVTAIAQQQIVTGKMPPPPAPPANAPILVAVIAPTPAPPAMAEKAPAEEAPATLPKTGSALPLELLLGSLMLAGMASIRLFRKVRG